MPSTITSGGAAVDGAALQGTRKQERIGSATTFQDARIHGRQNETVVASTAIQAGALGCARHLKGVVTLVAVQLPRDRTRRVDDAEDSHVCAVHMIRKGDGGDDLTRGRADGAVVREGEPVAQRATTGLRKIVVARTDPLCNGSYLSIRFHIIRFIISRLKQKGTIYLHITVTLQTYYRCLGSEYDQSREVGTGRYYICKPVKTYGDSLVGVQPNTGGWVRRGHPGW